MDKLSITNTFQKTIDVLKTTECSQKEKITHFGHIVECLQSSTLRSNPNYFTWLSTGLGILLLFCEDSDSVTRMNAEENLNKIIRFCENGYIVRVQIELYHEIKRNGNERSLRICLNLFSHYCHLIKQRKSRSFAQNLLPCIYAISRRKESLLIESLCEFLKTFCTYLEICMNDNEIVKLIEIFVEDIKFDCSIKRRCAAQNVITLIEHSRKVDKFAAIALNMALDFLIKDQSLNTVLGVLGFLRILLPITLKCENCDYIKMIEIYELCLQYLYETNHTLINASLEVINVMLVNANGDLKRILKNSDAREFLLKRKTLKNLIFHFVLTESKMNSRKSSCETLKAGLGGGGGVGSLKVEDRSVNASDVELESLKSMDFDTEIELSETKVEGAKRGGAGDEAISLKSQKSTDSIGSFFNSLLHTNTDGVTKFFRVKNLDSPLKWSGGLGGVDDNEGSAVAPPMKICEDDTLSLESMNNSFVSMQSLPEQSEASILMPVLEDESITDMSTISETINESMPEIKIETVPDEKSFVQINRGIEREITIGTILDQTILEYTVRLICSKFLLSGVEGELMTDSYVRVSIKNLSLAIVANCVAINPQLLLNDLERDQMIGAVELQNYEILNEDEVGEIDEVIVEPLEPEPIEEIVDENLLEIKDDHFGESSAKFLDLFSTLSKSVDETPLNKFEVPPCMSRSEILSEKLKVNMCLNRDLTNMLCNIKISGTGKGSNRSGNGQKIYDILLFAQHSDPILRSNVQNIIGNFIAGIMSQLHSVQYDDFIMAAAANDGKSKLFLNLSRLIGIIVEGLFDEIHMVVKQALNALENIFPFVIPSKAIPVTSKTTFSSSATHNHLHHQRKSEGGGDDPNNLDTKTPPSSSISLPCDIISKQFILENLFLVHDNRYWVVQCKYADVITNLDYNLIKMHLNANCGIKFQTQCLEHLLHLLKDNDIRVRNYVGPLFYNFIQNQHKINTLQDDSSNNIDDDEDYNDDDGDDKMITANTITKDFINQRIFNELPIPLRYVNTTPKSMPKGSTSASPYSSTATNKTLAQVLYMLSNKLLEIDDKNQQLGVINAIKGLVLRYNPIYYNSIWDEYKFLDVCVNFLTHNLTIGADITCHTDMMVICTHLMAGSTFAVSKQNKYLKIFLTHLLKIMNIFDHLFANLKPIVIPKGQKADLFVGAKELQALNKIGYFGNSHFYLKLYKNLKNAFDSYKITINKESGVKLFTFLKTTLNALTVVLEIKLIENLSISLKFIEEILSYLTTLIIYVPKNSVICTKSLLKYLFGRNFISRRQNYDFFINKSFTSTDEDGMIELFEYIKEFYFYKPSDILAFGDTTADLGNYIKLFEPMVIYCLKLFTKSNAEVQTEILEMLCQLLEFKVNYCLLDANSVFICFVLRLIDNIETGTVRNCELLIPNIMKFLFHLSKQKDKKLITIPKIINITDNLLANNMIRNGSITSLVELAYEIFFIQKISSSSSSIVLSPTSTSTTTSSSSESAELQAKDLCTQKEVVFAMLQKFINYFDIQKITSVILLSSESYQPPEPSELIQTIIIMIQDKRLAFKDEPNATGVAYLLQTIQLNVLMDPKIFTQMLKLLFKTLQTEIVTVQELTIVNLILEHVLLRTDENYVDHQIKFYLASKDETTPNALRYFVDEVFEFAKRSISALNVTQSENKVFVSVLRKLLGRLQKLAHFRKVSALLCVKLKSDKSFIVESVLSKVSSLIISFYIEVVVVGGGDRNRSDVGTEEGGFDCLNFLRNLNEIPGTEDVRINAVKKICDTMNAYNLNGAAIKYILEHYFETIWMNCRLFSIDLISSDAYCVLFYDSMVNYYTAHSSEENLNNLLELCEYASSTISMPIINYLCNEIIIKKRGIVVKQSALICFKKISNLQQNPFNNDAKCEINTKQLNNLIMKFNFDEKYPNIFKKYETQLKLSCNLISQPIGPVGVGEQSMGGASAAGMTPLTIDTIKSLIANDEWYYNQVTHLCTTKSSSRSKLKKSNIVDLLYEIQSESKLQNLFDSPNFELTILMDVIEISSDRMIKNFKIVCVQHNPHIHYLRIPLLLKIALHRLQQLLDQILNENRMDDDDDNGHPHDTANCKFEVVKYSVINFIQSLNCLEDECLVNIEAKLIEKFIKDNFLMARQSSEPYFIGNLLQFAKMCLQRIGKVSPNQKESNCEWLKSTFLCVDLIFGQKYLGLALNGNEHQLACDGEQIIQLAVNRIYEYLSRVLMGTNFARKYRNPELFERLFTDHKYVETYLKAIFIAKYCEECDKIENISKLHQMQEIVLSVATSVLRTNFLYSFAVTPFELYSNYKFDLKDLKSNRIVLPLIPIDYLNDVEILEKFVKRVNIFGFTSRQHFEEYFMSLLVLVNKETDVQIVDIQEQHCIRNMCLHAIVELLTSLKTYPTIGNRNSKFYHSPRLNKIKIDTISLKKLHKIQCGIPKANVFYQANLERKYLPTTANCAATTTSCDNVIGTNYFLPNQIGLNHTWQLVEENAIVSNISIKNSKYFIEQLDIDVRSSLQLIYDVFSQLIDVNYVLVLPHLMKLSEICENRQQYKWIKDTMLILQEKVPLEDTVSHQYIIFLLCKSYAVLVPSLSDLTHLCTLIPTYLKSTHLFIRNSTLSGLLCLLESCVNTNTTIGSLNEEVLMIRNVVINYIIKYGINEESSLVYSDVHTKLVWTLNFYLIEKTSKFIPECTLLSNTIISANNVLKNTSNLEQYLCILNGLERLVVTNTTNKMQREKIEKLVLDLIKLENEEFSIAALKLLITCMYIGSSEQIENTEHSNGIVQDEPEVIVQSIEKIDVLFMRIKSSKTESAEIFGSTLCQIVKDLVPPNEILTKVIKELLSLSQPHCEVVAKIVFQVFRSAIDSSYHSLLQDWLICSLPNFVSLPVNKAIWCLSIIFVSASINLNIVRIFYEILGKYEILDERDAVNFMIASKDFYDRLTTDQRLRFRDVFKECEAEIFTNMLQCL